MAGVRIVTDSACDLPDDVVEQFNIAVVPLTIRFGEEEFIDREELSAKDFYAKMAVSDVLPATAAPGPGKFLEAFSRAADEGASAVVCVNLSEKLSATIQSARTAAADLDGKFDVRVIDSRSITSGLGTQVMLAAEAAAEGRSLDDVVATAESASHRINIFGALATLDNLKKGGRIGGAQAMLGNLLSIKPVIDISTGEVHEAAKLRTRRKAMLWLRDKVFAQPEVEHLVLPNGFAEDQDEFRALFAERFDVDSLLPITIGATIGAHGGPGIIGASWLTPA
jgi:DegV family protein with EDD domain